MQRASTKMRLNSLGTIVTRRVSSAMLISAALLAGCRSVPEVPRAEWKVRDFYASTLHPVSANSVDQVLVEQLIEDYRRFPKDGSYSRLNLSRVLEAGEGGGRRYFVFDVQYVDDVAVVYVLDSRNAILDKFLISPWIR